MRIQNKMGKPYVDSQDLGKLRQQLLNGNSYPKETKQVSSNGRKLKCYQVSFWTELL